MGYRQPPHHIYLAYRTLVGDLRVGEAEALHRLRRTFAGMPVDLIVQTRGDLTRTLEVLTGAKPPMRSDSGKVDKRTGERLLRELTLHAYGEERATNCAMNNEALPAKPTP